MTGFQHLSVRLKILSVAGLGIFLFLAYFLYSYYTAEPNIDHLRQVESHDFPVLELANANNVEFWRSAMPSTTPSARRTPGCWTRPGNAPTVSWNASAISSVSTPP